MRRLRPGTLLVAAVLMWPTLLAAQEESPQAWFSPEQLDNLLAPVALYPDPLLAQVLIAATFPDEIDDAARFVRNDANPSDIDLRGWDVSVKSVAHYPEVLEMMADDLDWTTALGQAYVYQSTDVMAAVQRLRAQARAAGNLDSTSEMEIEDVGGVIEIWPAQPEYIYVPRYNPALVYSFRAPLFFGVRFLIGAWLNLDFDWREHRVFYHGWEHGRGWMERSRPYVRITNVYVRPNYRTVVVNRRVVHRPVNYVPLDRFHDVHHTTNFGRSRGPGREVNPPTPPQHVTIQNKIITRNINVGDPRLKEYRGHAPKPPERVEAPKTPAFTPAQSVFDPHVASDRGRASRSRAPSSSPSPEKHERKERR
jgi:hypothetical protein